MGLRRTSPDSVLFTTYNAYDLFLDGLADGCERYRLVTGIIRDIGPDVLAIQEIRADDEDAARSRLRKLAADTGLNCLVPGQDGNGSRPALAMGSHGYHVGLLWREEIEPVPGSLRLRAQDFWHGLVSVGLDVGGRRVRHACYHAPPFGRPIRAAESELVVAMLSNPASAVVIGADWNGESADRVPDGAGGSCLYEPGDPYRDVDWFPHMTHQCEWDYDGQGRRRHRVDRSAGEVLWAGGLHDAAAALAAPWQPTVGHHPDDPYGVHGISRRIDAVRVTGRVLGALRGYHVTDTDEARRASDHLAVTTEYLPSAVAAAPGRGSAGSAGQAA